mmetsp:Transcript_25015/g.50268  ORF Transcript_25015/g.50268 Transcript_25015/m.50268 type:complete len:88 (-) Transcript_25015:440-703(-)
MVGHVPQDDDALCGHGGCVKWHDSCNFQRWFQPFVGREPRERAFTGEGAQCAGIPGDAASERVRSVSAQRRGPLVVGKLQAGYQRSA